MKLARGIK